MDFIQINLKRIRHLISFALWNFFERLFSCLSGSSRFTKSRFRIAISNFQFSRPNRSTCFENVRVCGLPHCVFVLFSLCGYLKNDSARSYQLGCKSVRKNPCFRRFYVSSGYFRPKFNNQKSHLIISFKYSANYEITFSSVRYLWDYCWLVIAAKINICAGCVISRFWQSFFFCYFGNICRFPLYEKLTGRI